MPLINAMKKHENFNEMGTWEMLLIMISKAQGLYYQLGYMTSVDHQNTEEPFLATVGPCKSMNRYESKRNKRLYITHLDIQ